MNVQQALASQRKDQDAALAAQHDIKVPYIFPTFEEAKYFVLDNGGSVIARTEHPTELNGLSGLNYSHVITPEKVARHEEKGGLLASFRDLDDQLFKLVARTWHKSFQHTEAYCHIFKIDPEEYVNELEHSFWEYIPGHNLYVFANPTVAGRYHIFSQWTEPGEEYGDRSTYDLFENNEILTEGYTASIISDRIQEIATLYEKVRNVFGNKVCWVVEMQIAESGELYFLQRSIGHDVTPQTWSLKGAPNNSWEFRVGPEHDFGEVIGVTPERGVEVDVILERSTRLMWLTKDIPSGILSSHIQSTVIEQESIKDVAAYIETYYQCHGSTINDPHSSIIPMIRAPLYLHMPKWHDVMPKDIQTEIDRVQKEKCPKEDWPRDRFHNPDYMTRFKLLIRSDGCEARVQVLEIY